MLTEKEMIKIAKDTNPNKLDKLNVNEKLQFMNFMFGKEFMKSNNKGSKVTYK